MLPELFGFLDTYSVCLIIALGLAAFLFFFFLKKLKLSRLELIDMGIVVIVAFIAGLIFAILFQNFYDFLETGKFTWTWAMTFYGGLIGGAGGFLLTYFFFYKKAHPGIMDKILFLAPLSITSAHAIGRIGCFCAGCCYGHESTAWYSLYFPILDRQVIPTQLYEAIFLAVLSVVLFIMIKKDFKYTLPTYMISYGIWRFLIEFVRDDHRGGIQNFLSPSQVICVLAVIGSIAIYLIERKFVFKNGKE